jgi:hypothetical protein
MQKQLVFMKNVTRRDAFVNECGFQTITENGRVNRRLPCALRLTTDGQNHPMFLRQKAPAFF